MNKERSPESRFFQSSCEAVLRQDYKEAFSLLEKGLKEARNIRMLAEEDDVLPFRPISNPKMVHLS